MAEVTVEEELMYGCPDFECGGRLEVTCTGWLTLNRNVLSGDVELSVFGFSESDITIACNACGRQTEDEALIREVRAVIYGNGGPSWFTG